MIFTSGIIATFGVVAGRPPPAEVNKYLLPHDLVTSQRMILTSGLLTRKVAMMPLVKVTDMSFQRTFFGRLFGYGEFIIESAGQDQALRTIDHIPYPEQPYLEVCNLIFLSKDRVGDSPPASCPFPGVRAAGRPSAAPGGLAQMSADAASTTVWSAAARRSHAAHKQEEDAE
jgi:hypothetical protein